MGRLDRMTSWADPPRPTATERAKDHAEALRIRRRTALVEAGFFLGLTVLVIAVACGLAVALGAIL
jgi:hypothetical protein